MADESSAGIVEPLLNPDAEGARVEKRVTAAATRPWRLPMIGRDPLQEHRAATPLELFFDLVFVVAVAQAARELHHALAAGDVGSGLFSYLIVFFTIWWPWVNFTWFASAFDTDDVPYRLLTFVQMTGVLVVAAGVPRVFEGLDFSIAVVGYVIMRIGLVLQWLRVAREDPTHRRAALRFAVGITLVQVLWVVRLAFDGPVSIGLLFALGVAEMLIPAWAERAGSQTPWNPEHIAERYGLFTIIVLGECVLAASMAVQVALDAGGASSALIAVGLGGLLMLFSLWWSYFKLPTAIGHHLPLRWQLAWGYGHYVLFAAVAALGAGLQLAIEAVTDPEHVAPITAAMAVAIPTVIFMAAVAILHHRGAAWSHVTSVAPGAIAVLLAAASASIVGVPVAVLAMGVLLAAVVGWHVAGVHRSAVAA